MQNENWEGLCAFCRGSSYDLIQVRTEHGWGPSWTFESNNPAAAEKAGQMLQTMYGAAMRVRHVHKERVQRPGGTARTLVIVTELPSRQQTILDLESARVVKERTPFSDRVILALEKASGLEFQSGDNFRSPRAVEARAC